MLYKYIYIFSCRSSDGILHYYTYVCVYDDETITDFDPLEETTRGGNGYIFLELQRADLHVNHIITT